MTYDYHVGISKSKSGQRAMTDRESTSALLASAMAESYLLGLTDSQYFVAAMI